MSFRFQHPYIVKNETGNSIPPFSIVRVTGSQFRGVNNEEFILTVDLPDNKPGIWMATGPSDIPAASYNVAYMGHYLSIAYNGDADNLTVGDMVGPVPDKTEAQRNGLGGFRFVAKTADIETKQIILVERLTHWTLRGKLNGALSAATSMINNSTATVSVWSPTGDTEIDITVDNDDSTLTSAAGSLVRVVPEGVKWRILWTSCDAVT